MSVDGRLATRRRVSMRTRARRSAFSRQRRGFDATRRSRTSPARRRREAVYGMKGPYPAEDLLTSSVEEIRRPSYNDDQES